MSKRHQLTPSDILPMDEYARVRSETRKRIAEHKRHRRVDVGPFITFYFESYETMWLQVHEMIYIEKGGAEQVPDELTAYNPLIPNGRELVATFMIEIEDAGRRKHVLSTLGGVEDTAFIELNGETIAAMPEKDQDRTTADGKASSVQFVHFQFSGAQIAAFRVLGAKVVLGLKHPAYTHMTVFSEEVRSELAKDFD